jgi:hypothetical protein
MLYYTLRWESRLQGYTSAILTKDDYALAAGVYLLWQIFYFLKTEIIDRYRLDTDPEYLTSLRWLSRDSKNAVATTVLTFLRFIRFFRYNENYDANSFKTKLVFMTTQFLYTVFSFPISHFVFYSKITNLAYILTLFVISVYLGASYYIDIFSERYQLQFTSSGPDGVVEVLNNFVTEEDLIQLADGISIVDEYFPRPLLAGATITDDMVYPAAKETKVQGLFFREKQSLLRGSFDDDTGFINDYVKSELAAGVHDKEVSSKTKIL